jgi:indolepyruvate ferredoxin oxidoreductase
MQAVAAFAGANRLDRVVLDSRAARLGILATGKAYLDLRQALADLGDHRPPRRGARAAVYKVALTWPLEEAGARRFAAGLKDVLVVEEKRGFVEDQLVRILYNMDASKRPTVVGKRDEAGAPLLPSEGELTPTIVAGAVISPPAPARPCGPRTRAAGSARPTSGSGCPYNSSTKIPEGNRAMAGIGCHGMAL